MKKLITTLLFCCSLSFAQNNNYDIEIAPYIDNVNSSVPTEANQILLNKLADLITKNGVSKGVNSDFILTANTNVLTKEITPTAPTNYILELGVNLYIGNVKDGNLFNSSEVIVKGVGLSETKAYIDAIKKLNAKNKEVEKMISDAKSKIVDYYNKRCDLILAEASQLEKTNQFNEALYKLTSIPQACKECYTKAMSRAENVFKKAIDYDCKDKLNQAKQVFNANPNEQGAHEASQLLITVNPNANCFSEVKTFGAEISKKMKENDAREWNIYYEKQVGLEKDHIEAMKEIGKAYGQGQPKQIYNNIKWW